MQSELTPESLAIGDGEAEGGVLLSHAVPGEVSGIFAGRFAESSSSLGVFCQAMYGSGEGVDVFRRYENSGLLIADGIDESGNAGGDYGFA